MVLISLLQFIQRRFRFQRYFNEHFVVDHHFHGIKNHLISESYTIYPKSKMAIQLFHEGVQFPSSDLHLKCKIHKDWEKLKIQMEVNNPSVSKEIVTTIEEDLLEQLIRFQEMVEQDPLMNYIYSFCPNCHRHGQQPFTVCIKTCQFQTQDDVQHSEHHPLI